MARRPARRGFGQITRLPSKRYRARYTGPDAALHNAPNTFGRSEDAEAWLTDERRLIDKGLWTPPADRKAAMVAAAAQEAAPVLTVGAYVEREIENRATRTRKPIAPTTADLYRKDWRLRGHGIKDLPLTELDLTAVKAWWKAMPKGTPTQNGRAYDLLKSVMKEAVEEELIERNPCRIKGAGKPEPERTGIALTIPELVTYLEAVPARYRVALAVSAWCSLRSGEVRALRRRDIDLKRRVIHVRTGVSRVKVKPGEKAMTWRVAQPKTKAGMRDVAIPTYLVEPLKAWLASVPVTGLDGLVFPATDGRSPLHSSVLWDAHAKGKAAVKKPTLTIHDLRRTAATLAAQGGATTAELMRLLGHTTVNMAMVYQVASDDRDHARAARLDKQIEQALSDDQDDDGESTAAFA